MPTDGHHTAPHFRTGIGGLWDGQAQAFPQSPIPCVPLPMSYSVVWFKRDLRVVDHEALQLALRAGPVLCVYLVEPSLLRQPTVPSDDALGLPAHCPPERQRGGRAEGLRVLHSFLADRAAAYCGGISSPLTAPDACSRLSPYLTHGCLSVREVVQACQDRWSALPPGRQREGLRAMVGRLAWRDHFIQKLETQPDIEWRNLHRGYDGLREGGWTPEHFQALTEGRTGWRGSSSTTSPASTGARCKCSPAPPASTPPGSTTPSNRHKTTIRTASLCGAGCRCFSACPTAGCGSPGACRPTSHRAAARLAWSQRPPPSATPPPTQAQRPPANGSVRLIDSGLWPIDTHRCR